MRHCSAELRLASEKLRTVARNAADPRFQQLWASYAAVLAQLAEAIERHEQAQRAAAGQPADHMADQLNRQELERLPAPAPASPAGAATILRGAPGR